ncbi:hypothetical protein GCK72_009608 [Caenorhabditis remanei]|uniref:Uncharacterized protein n=1 Tax=Caenorhabditis remanei TaxID=31234 RepID=A0A6A5H4F4_CAERE|nr:hypothetical protein GCK72_009608 [Caenorhabditis remanei]KAF1761352.1 hypothetical protein GCK72_009608 [Caenorhabditis remanei]
MERMVSRVRRLSPLHTFSDALLISLLSESDFQPDNIQQGVVLFEKDEPTEYWYLLLSGEVQLYSKNYVGDFKHLKTLRCGSLFGDLSTTTHSCSCLVSRPAQLIRISQNHFLSVYNKHGDHLQQFIIIMHDILTDETPMDPIPTYSSGLFNGQRSNDLMTSEINPNEIVSVSTEGIPTKMILPSIPYRRDKVKNNRPVTQKTVEERNFIEFHNPTRIEKEIIESGGTLHRKMLTDNHLVIRDITTQHTRVQNCMIGAEMIDWLLTLFVSTSTTSSSLSRIQMSAIWQVLLNYGIIAHIDGEHQFMDKTNSYYRWVQPYRNRNKVAPTMEEVLKSISLLSSVAPETLFLMIVSKPGFERSPEELEVVYEELTFIKALSHLSTMVKRQLANFVKVEQFVHAGSVVFRQGEIGVYWYIVLKGAVEVNVNGKVVCVLREGDDFGKLALVNDLPRAATIVTYEDDSIFLVVDKHNFNQILHQVEANTVRLKDYGEDVLVLEKVDIPRGAALENSSFSSLNCGYSVMAGKAEKILEYVLETRIDALSDDISELDLFVEDFILTHDAFMPDNTVCNFLKTYYFRTPYRATRDSISDSCTEEVRCKRRVVQFVYIWCRMLKINFFLNPVTNSFVEELFCHVIDDRKRLGGMEEIMTRIGAIRTSRENMQLVLARHPAIVLDCGVLSAHTPCPILPSDVCNQIIYLADTTCFVLPIRVDKTAEEICELSRRRMSFSAEPLNLVEVKSNGEKLIFSPNDRAIPTVLSLNSKLYVVNREEIPLLVPMEDQNGPTPSSHSSILHLIDSQELAHQLFLFHLQLLRATDSNELLYQVIGRESFPLSMPFNLDLLVRRFNEVQHWSTTEILLASEENRVEILKKFIAIATIAREYRDLLTVFAITLGLSHTSVSRLTLTWSKLPPITLKTFSELEHLLDPTRNHRMYRLMVSKMASPYIPFVPLILKDLMFIHQGNKSFYNGLVNFEKMHMFAKIFRNFRQCKSQMNDSSDHEYVEPQSLIRNLRVIDNQKKLMQISYEIEPKTTRRNIGFY